MVYLKRSSYRYNTRNPLVYKPQSARQKGKRKSKIYIEFVFLLISLAFLAWILLASKYYRITSVVVDISGEERDRILAVIPTGSSIFLFSPANERALITSLFPEIKNVKFSFKLPSTVSISIEKRQPYFVISAANGTFQADIDGMVFAVGSNPGKYILVSTKANVSLGQQFLDSQELTSVGQVIEYLKINNNAIVTDIFVSATQLEFKVQDGWRLVMSPLSSTGAQLDNFSDAWGKLSAGDRSNLNYIDVSSSKQIYYKFK